jgi:amino acid adenylation domain-containing protein
MSPQIIEGYPLSPQQAELWRSLQRRGGRGHSAQCDISIEGRIDQTVLETALRRVIERHEILRTSYRVLPEIDLPLQIVSEQPRAEIHCSELNGRDHVETAEIGRASFDPAESPPIGFSLIRRSPSKLSLLISLPALSTDKAGLANLMREIAQVYSATLSGRKDLPEPLQYPDLTEWQNELSTGDDAEPGKKFWREQLTPGRKELTLPFERRASAGTEFTSRVMGLVIAEATVQKLDGLAQKYETSAGVALLACWKILLAPLTGQSEIRIECVFSGRSYVELEGALGLFARRLPLESRLDPAARFSDLLKQVHRLSRKADDWQECFSPEHDAESERADFSIGFEYEVWPEPHREDGVCFTIDDWNHSLGRDRIRLCCARKDDSLRVEFQYDANLFDGADIERLAEQFQALLESILNCPEAMLDELCALSGDERRRLTDEFNRTRFDYPRETLAHQLFETQVEQRPDAVAIVFENDSLTYETIDCRANRIANRLRGLGVGPESIVALMLDRSPDALIGLLAVRKAGGAYLPLDPAWPKDRLATILDDARPLLALAHRKLADRLDAGQFGICFIEDELELALGDGDSNPKGIAAPANLAYVIYTSGSTGKPKGVAVEDWQLLNYIHGIQENLKLQPGASVAVVSTFAADLGYTAVFPSLCMGGCLHIIPTESAADSQALSEYFRQRPIDFLKITPSHLAALIENCHDECLIPLQALALGGEASNWKLIQRILSLRGACRVFNHYGPTETTVGVLMCRLENAAVPSTTAPLGRPIANSNVYVLNSRLAPVPTWRPGQIHIGGDGVARGYLNSPGQTAERFIPHPSSQDPGARCYVTGDLGRFLPDGRIEYLGRIDHQVKIRGFRLELGEIEAVLRRCPVIRECVVVVREDSFNEKSLIAYVAPFQKAEIDPAEARRFLRERLPDYMIPSAIVVLNALPLTSNGKIDRRALPEPHRSPATSRPAQAAPRTAVEELLAGVWAEVLGVNQVGVDDNFFELGGHSLLAMRLVSRLRTVFGVEIALRALFEAPSLRKMARLVEQAAREDDSSKVDTIERAADRRTFPLSFSQRRIWFFDQLASSNEAYNIPFIVRIDGELNFHALRQSLSEILRRHEILRTRLIADPKEPLQVVAVVDQSPIRLIDSQRILGTSPEEWIESLSAMDSLRPFDLANGPMLRSVLFKFGPTNYALSLTTHHFVSDGWSTEVLVREFISLYKTFRQGGSSPLAESTIQYTDFALWQRRWLEGNEPAAQLSYWTRRLAGVPPLLELPTDRPRPAMQSYKGARHWLTIPSDSVNALKNLGRKAGATLFMTLLAAFETLLFRYTGQSQFSIGAPIAGRNRMETEGLIGYFANTLVLSSDFSKAQTFLELLEQVREATLGAYSHQDVPFEMLVEALQPARNLSHNPLFQVLFTLRNPLTLTSQLPGLKWNYLRAAGSAARFDLALELGETEEGLSGCFEYNTDLFDEGTIERMTGHYLTLLTEIAANPDRLLSTIPILTSVERRQLLTDWNNSDAESPRMVSNGFHCRFEQQAVGKPDAVAVSIDEQQLTYGELNRRANQLAHYLRGLGAGPDVMIGVMMERSLEMIVSLIGVLKAGAAYVPLDPSFPAERLDFMAGDSGILLLLTKEALGGRAPIQNKLYLDADWASIARCDECNPVPIVEKDHLTYVIFTSGSTGKPKGVQISHRALTNFLFAIEREIGFTEHERLLSVTTLSFDIAGLELFLPLCCGARLVMASREDAMDGEALARLIRERNTTFMQGTPATWRLLMETGWQGDGRLKCLCGGEALPPDLAAELSGKNAEAWNLYGPTETTIWSTASRLRIENETISIGRPIANTQLYVLDSHLQPTPVGVIGELYIGGDGLARGYLRRPDVTAEKFVPDHLGSWYGRRLYRTGDLVRYLADGELEYLGRADYQLKIRGYRIEAGEIETALSSRQEIQRAVVIAHKDQRSENRLAAYIVPRPDRIPSISELRQFLREKLPDYMIPSWFVTLEALPLGPSGKLDRRALPAPDETASEAAPIALGPRTRTEEKLAGIFTQTLGLEGIGVFDDFFELGGHSLLAAQAASRVRAAFGVDLPLRAFFEKPMVSGLAVAVAQGLAGAADPRYVEQALSALEQITEDDALIMLTGY